MNIAKATLVKGIKEKCKDCCGSDFSQIKACSVKCCPLVPIKNLLFNGISVEAPKSNRGIKVLSPEHKAKLAEGRARAKAERNSK